MTNRSKVEQELIKANIKVTDARCQILLLFYQEKGHYSAEEINIMLTKQDSNIGLATIYRTLVQLEAVGLILRHGFLNGIAVYELNDGDHGHIVCLNCGNIAEFNDHIINDRQAELAKELGIKTVRHSHVIYGICQNCR